MTLSVITQISEDTCGHGRRKKGAGDLGSLDFEI